MKLHSNILLILIYFLFVSSPAVAGETRFADPQPDFDNPRRIMLQLTTDDPKIVNRILSHAINLQKAYGMDNVEIAVIAYGPGMWALYRETSKVRERIESLLKYDVTFYGCANTMDVTGHSEADLIEGVDFVQAGIAEIVERQLKGWIYVAP